MPMGNPVLDRPHGTETPGIPAKDAVTVKISARYIERGSSAYSPNLKAAVGVVGVTIASTTLKASVKSRAISVRTFCAFK